MHIEPGHRRAGLEGLEVLDPIVLAHIGGGDAEVGGIGRAPRALHADRVALEGCGRIELAVRRGVACGMAIMAAADDCDVRAALDRDAGVLSDSAGRQRGCQDPKVFHRDLPSK
jgi:hypothetical protein